MNLIPPRSILRRSRSGRIAQVLDDTKVEDTRFHYFVDIQYQFDISLDKGKTLKIVMYPYKDAHCSIIRSTFNTISWYCVSTPYSSDAEKRIYQERFIGVESEYIGNRVTENASFKNFAIIV